MNQSETFRRILIVATLILVPIAGYYRIRSQATGERLDRRQEGLFILLTLRPLGAITMLSLIAYLVNPAWMAWSSMALPGELRWIGVGLGVSAGVLLIWTLHHLGRNLTDTVVTRKDHTLVTRGPYRWVRHPFYDAMALSLLANGLVAANWFLLLTGALLLGLIGMRTRKEEQNLLARFGDAYRKYRERTGSFLPRIGDSVPIHGERPDGF